MDQEQIDRRKALGIPVHESEEDCLYDMQSGYCICGNTRPSMNKKPMRTRYRVDGTRAPITLDTYERGEPCQRAYY